MQCQILIKFKHVNLHYLCNYIIIPTKTLQPAKKTVEVSGIVLDSCEFTDCGSGLSCLQTLFHPTENFGFSGPVRF